MIPAVIRFLLVCGGGALGSGARYLVALWAARVFGTGAPWGTLVVNVVGSFAMGVMMELAMRTAAISPETRLFVTTGLLGGFTTYSAFNFETTGFLRSGAPAAALLNVVATVVGCLLAGVAGYTLGKWLVAR